MWEVVAESYGYEIEKNNLFRADYRIVIKRNKTGKCICYICFRSKKSALAYLELHQGVI